MQSTREQEKGKVPVIEVDERQLGAHVSEVVRQSVEEPLNSLLDAEADELCKARRYERNSGGQAPGPGTMSAVSKSPPDTFGSRFQSFAMCPLRPPLLSVTGAGKVRSRRRLWRYIWPTCPFARWNITEALWGTRVSPSTISDLNQKIFERVEVWRNRPLEKNIRMFLWTASGSGDPGAARSRRYRCEPGRLS